MCVCVCACVHTYLVVKRVHFLELHTFQVKLVQVLLVLNHIVFDLFNNLVKGVGEQFLLVCRASTAPKAEWQRIAQAAIFRDHAIVSHSEREHGRCRQKQLADLAVRELVPDIDTLVRQVRPGDGKRSSLVKHNVLELDRAWLHEFLDLSERSHGVVTTN